MCIMITILLVIMVLSFLILIHELGHFLAAKKQGIAVEEFGLGLPPRIIGLRRKDRRLEFVSGKQELEKGGPTVYSLNWIPVGGFVRIKGESGEKDKERDSFASRGFTQRSMVVLMGVFANVFLTAILFFLGFAVGLPQVIGEQISPSATITNRQIEILSVLPDSPAQKAGIKSGDTILSLEGETSFSIDWFKKQISQRTGQETHLTIRRQNETIIFTAVPEVLKEIGQAGIGIGLAEVGTVRYPIGLALVKGVTTTGLLVKMILQAFGGIIHDLILGKKITADIAGPVGIAVLTGQAVQMGWIYLLQFVAIFSINLAILNALPFPALDGGRFLFLLLERFRGRPISRKIELAVHNAGFVLLLLLVLLVTYRDIARYSNRIAEWAVKLIQ